MTRPDLCEKLLSIVVKTPPSMSGSKGDFELLTEEEVLEEEFASATEDAGKGEDE